jgi:hypothetical protein
MPMVYRIRSLGREVLVSRDPYSSRLIDWSAAKMPMLLDGCGAPRPRS